MFDFDATLPVMAVQFLLLAVVLNAIFYKPLTQSLDARSEYIRTNEVDANDRLTKAEALTKQYEQELAEARRKSQSVIATAQAEAQKVTATLIAEAQQQAQLERENAQREIDQQKQTALASLELQVDSLSHQILQKLLGHELAG